MLLPDLPDDVLETMVEAVTQIDAKTLPALSLVSRAFRCPSQREIFRDVELAPTSSYDLLTPSPHHLRLRDILKENPTLATYIRGLYCFQFPNRLGPGVPINTLDAAWMVDHGLLLAEILQLLEFSPIQKIVVISSLNSGLLRWTALHQILQDTFLGFFTKSSITSVTFSGLLLPQNIFSTFADVKDLYLGNCSWSTQNLLTPPGPRTTAPMIHKLLSLRLLVSDTLPIESIGRPIGLDLSGVCTLLIIGYTLPFPNLTRLISLPSLKDLTITQSRIQGLEQGRHDDLGLDLSPAIGLCSLTLRCGLMTSVEGFSWIDPFLSSLPTESPIQKLSLSLEIYGGPPGPAYVDPFKILSKALSSFHQRFHMIEQIRVEMKLPCRSVDSQEQLERFWEQVREQLVWRGCEGVFLLETLMDM
ncbi:hypothetical protein BDN72DRAFT_961467 [Pluteus cervinus]|uniref:Uncharacterized protein n=1 Tax=Pluteus cervinus TaxID=181527 RepID=A0ACD3AMR2_9AGAR|nr:hypothetical protein BDN72DRAFT_961467 [Pluteus cervinus]